VAIADCRRHSQGEYVVCLELLLLVTSAKLFVKGGCIFLLFALSSFWKFQEESYIVVWEDYREEQETTEKLKGRREERGKEQRLIQEKG